MDGLCSVPHHEVSKGRPTWRNNTSLPTNPVTTPLPLWPEARSDSPYFPLSASGAVQHGPRLQHTHTQGTVHVAEGS